MNTPLLAENTTTPYLINPSFSGHQTFTFRYTWLKKGVDAVKENPHIFSSDNATVVLGVGKNMVNSIRHWCLVADLIQKIPNGSGTDRRRGFQVTEFGKAVFDDIVGLDPYLEKPVTLWLIHWKIATNFDHASAGLWAFNFCNYPEFTRLSLTEDLMNWLKQENKTKKQFSENTIKQDVNCFIRTYCPPKSSEISVLEDTFDCPLIELDLIREIPGEHRYRFNFGAKYGVTDSMIAFTIYDFWKHHPLDTNTLSFLDIMYSKWSPGQVFKLDENTMVMHLEKLDWVTDSAITYGDTAGLKQIFKGRHLDTEELLTRIYE